MCGSCANESAYKVAMIAYAQRKRGGMGEAASELELGSCLQNKPPGCANYGILSFQLGYHGRMFGSNSTSRTKPIEKLDTPAFDWPAAEPPRYKWPLDENKEYNKA